jgi:hypothetical protein
MDIADRLARYNVISASGDFDLIRARRERRVGAAGAQRHPRADKTGAESHFHVWLHWPADSARSTFLSQTIGAPSLTIDCRLYPESRNRARADRKTRKMSATVAVHNGEQAAWAA